MRKLIRASKLIFVVLGVGHFGVVAQDTDSFEIKPKFKCGRYRIDGRIILNQQKFVILQGRPRTPVVYEMILDGVPLDELIARNDTQTLVEVEIRKEESRNHPLRAEFKRFVAASDYRANLNAYNLVKPLDCW